VYCVILSSSTYSYDVPLAAWAGKDLFKGEHVGVSNYVNSMDSEILLRSFIHTDDRIGVLSQYVDSKVHPEVLVIFMEAQLRSEQLSTYASSLVKFRNIFKNAQSSLQVPFVDMPHAFDIHMLNVVTKVKINDGKVFYLGKGSPLLKDILNREQKTISSSDFANVGSLFVRHDKIFSNGRTDLILVYLSSTDTAKKFEETDNVIADIHHLITSHTENYVCVYTGLAYDNPEFNVDFGTQQTPLLKRSLAYVLQHDNDTNSTNGSIPVFRQYFGGWFWELFVVMIFLVPLLIIGTYSIDSIQTPIFEPKKKN
jgi:hypothetical protein